MRKILPVVLAALLAAAAIAGPAFAAEANEAPFTEERAVLCLEQDGGAELRVRNDALTPVCVYATAESQNGGALCVRVEQSGRETTVFEGSAEALSEARVLLCTLEPDGSARLTAVLTGGEGDAALVVQKVPAEDGGGPGRLRVLFFVCVWVALAVFGAYLVVAFHRRFSSRGAGG